jgi:hypothetical protein
VRARTSAGSYRAYPSIIELTEAEMTSIGSKIFGTIIGSAIFFGVGIALAHAAVIG